MVASSHEDEGAAQKKRRLDGGAEDVAAAHRLRQAYSGPSQSKFRVAAVLRFHRTDGSFGTIEAVNAEPHDANIRGAICAERAALCKFAQAEALSGSQVVRVVCVTDNARPIFPGPLCREFLASVCSEDAEVLCSGAAEPAQWSTQRVSDLWPLPSVYSRKGQDEIKALAAELSPKAQVPAEASPQRRAYDAALALAKKQSKQTSIFPVCFAAAVCCADGGVHTAAELKGVEYGCTVDAVTQLLPQMLRAKESAEAESAPVAIMQVDQFGLAHAPFAAARSLLIEHGFGNVLLGGHLPDGSLFEMRPAVLSLPFADFELLA